MSAAKHTRISTAGKKARIFRKYGLTKDALAAVKLRQATKRARIKAAKAEARAGIEIAPVGGSGGELRLLRFGAVTVSNTAPNARTVEVNVKAGRDALGRAKAAFIKPGVRLYLQDGIPKFRVAADDPRIVIRELDGRIERGRIVGDRFVTGE